MLQRDGLGGSPQTARSPYAAIRDRMTFDWAFTETLCALALILLAISGVVFSAWQPWVDPRWLYMDTQTVGEIRGNCCHVYDGAISNLGIMLWAGTAALALFAFTLKLSVKHDCRLEGFAFVVSAALLVDDAFLLHEVVLPKFGVPQVMVIAALGVLTLSYLYAARRRIWRFGRSWLLYLGLGMFAVSLGIDQIISSTDALMIVLEDGPKFVGILCWFLFHLSLFREDMVKRSQRLD